MQICRYLSSTDFDFKWMLAPLSTKKCGSVASVSATLGFPSRLPSSPRSVDQWHQYPRISLPLPSLWCASASLQAQLPRKAVRQQGGATAPCSGSGTPSWQAVLQRVVGIRKFLQFIPLVSCEIGVGFTTAQLESVLKFVLLVQRCCC